jgi:2'-5' RNA ligase superfamily
VAEAEAAVEPFRPEGDWSSAHGVPVHMTIAGPWPSSLSLPIDDLAGLAAEVRIRFVLDELGTLGDAVCLFPADDGDLLRLRASILEAVGTADAIDENWRMHLTVCRGATRNLIETVEGEIAGSLPISCSERSLLLAQMDSDSSRSRREGHRSSGVTNT